MKTKKPIFVILILSVVATLIFPFPRVYAAVPVETVQMGLIFAQQLAALYGYNLIDVPDPDGPGPLRGDNIRNDLKTIHEYVRWYNTCLPGDPALGLFAENCLPQILKSLSGSDPVFQFNLFNTLWNREQDFIKSFELQKIEKAREDVNKLIFEVETELIDQGTMVEYTDPVTGAQNVMKKPGRIIRSVDNFIFEEPIQKARDYIYCYFGGDLTPPPAMPWKILPLGRTQAESISIQKTLRDEFLQSIHRKATYIITAPHEEWYTQERCGQLLESYAPIGADAPKQIIEETPSLPMSLTQIKNTRGYFTLGELNQAVTDPNNTVDGIRSKVQTRIDSIIKEYHIVRSLEYLAGQGLRSEKVYLANQPTVPGEQVYFTDTEYIISPAVVLLQKMQAATQAQFDLAQNAYADVTDPDRLDEYNLRVGPDVAITNSGGQTVTTVPGWIKPDPTLDTLKFRTTTDPSLNTTLTGLPAPWEDSGSYNFLPLTRGGSGSKIEGYFPENYMVPEYRWQQIITSIWGPGAYSNITNFESLGPDPLRPSRQRSIFPSYRWFDDITEMYDAAVEFGIDDYGTGPTSNIGWNVIMHKWFARENNIDWASVFFGL